MSFLVPYDGSPIADAALDRAVEHGRALNEQVVAVSLVPTGSDYVERRKWIDPDEEFALDTARATLERKISEATDDVERSFERSAASAPADGVTERIREIAAEIDASVLFVGSRSDPEDRLTTPFGPVAPQGAYDVHIVRST